jgi:ribonuclease P protein component
VAVAASHSSRGAKNPRRFGLDSERRLANKADFERLLRKGERRTIEGYTFYMQKRDAGPPRLGMLVTRQHAARATVRNRIKRCVREAFRLEQASLGALDILVRPPFGQRPGADMIARLRGLFSRLNS